LRIAGAVLQALEEHRHKELVSLNCIGISEDSEAEELIRLFRANPSIDVYLALSASMKPADLTRVADRFAAFRPNKLLFTAWMKPAPSARCGPKPQRGACPSPSSVRDNAFRKISGRQQGITWLTW
jgi:hypothetical protein